MRIFILDKENGYRTVSEYDPEARFQEILDDIEGNGYVLIDIEFLDTVINFLVIGKD